MVPPSHFPLLAEEKILCAGGGIFFAAIMRASRGGRLFLYGEYYLRGDIRAVQESWCRGRARRAGRRRRPHAAEGRGARPGRGGLPCGP